MSWANKAILELQNGNETVITPYGNSMKGLVESGSRVELRPTQAEDLKEGSIVLVKVNGKVYLHLIKKIKDNQFLIGNNRGGTNGWVELNAIYGIKK